MKCLKRNMTEFEYLPYTGTDTDVNDDGDHTGEFHRQYGEPIPYKGNISSPSGYTNQTFYGLNIQYTHALVMDDPNAKIDEYGVVRWKGDLYDITAVRPSINSLSIALKKQTKDHAPEKPEGDGE